MITLYELKHTRCCRCYHKQPFYIRNIFLMALLTLALTVIYFIYFSKNILNVQQIPKLFQGRSSPTFNTLEEDATTLQADIDSVKFDADVSEISYKTFYYKCVSLNKVCFIKNLGGEWPAQEKWRFSEGLDYLKGKIDGKVDVYMDVQSGKNKQDDLFKKANLSRKTYSSFLEDLLRYNSGVVMKDRTAAESLRKDIKLPEFLTQF